MHSESYDEIRAAAERREDKQSTKRAKISSMELTIPLGNVIHSKINANFLSPLLKQRFMGSRI